MRESNYWLRIIKASLPKEKMSDELNYLVEESQQLKNILGSIVCKTNTRQK